MADLHRNAWGYERAPSASQEAVAAPAVEPAVAPAPAPVKGKAKVEKATLTSLLAKLKSGEEELTSEMEEQLKQLGIK